jgi:hypothetical protein
MRAPAGDPRLGRKAAVAWLALFALMFANGALRVLVLEPRLGEDRARQLASLSGLALVLLVSSVLVRGSPGATSSQLWRTGLAWLGATVAFEFLFGRLVSGLSWSALLADYDVTRGRLWALIPLGVGVGPRLCRTLGAGRPTG